MIPGMHGFAKLAFGWTIGAQTDNWVLGDVCDLSEVFVPSLNKVEEEGCLNYSLSVFPSMHFLLERLFYKIFQGRSSLQMGYLDLVYVGRNGGHLELCHSIFYLGIGFKWLVTIIHMVQVRNNKASQKYNIRAIYSLLVCFTTRVTLLLHYF